MKQRNSLLILFIALCVALINLYCVKEMPTFTYYVPSTPQLLYPGNSARNINTSPSVRWSDTPGAMIYTAEISEDSLFQTGYIFNNNLTSTSWNLNNLKNGTVYYWRVSAANSSGTSAYSQVFWFLTVFEDSTYTP